MRDAIGGSVTLVIIVVFIVIALGYVAFNVNYTKAFRMKDKIISVYDDYKGDCQSACQDEISSYARSIGYYTDNNLNCGNWKKGINGIYCYKEFTVPSSSSVEGDSEVKKYYKIETKINIQIPIISNVFDFSIFYIHGDTKTYKMN